ncbi:hypothetical protein B6264_27235 [Kitasatospora aureofaciens]|nr:hypothetical protein B6264_27235 [Kitasatospora aureofaciens]QEU98663.1 hypothetical protein CP971_04470 [Streptomyces viridifaciens]
MSTYLALTFGTLLSSQGTDASFGPPSSGPSGRFVRVSSLPDVFRSVYRGFLHPKSGVNRRLAATRPTIAARPSECESGRAPVHPDGA